MMVDAALSPSATFALRRIWQEGRSTVGFRRLLVFSLIGAGLNAAIVLPLFMQRATGMLEDNPDLPELVRLALICFGLLAGGYLAEWGASRLAADINLRICHRLVTGQVEGYVRSQLEEFERHSAAQYQTAIGDVAEVLQTHQLFMLQSAVLSVAVTVFSLLLLALYDIWFVALALPFALGICGLPMLLAARADRFIAAEPDAFSGLGSYLETIVAGRHEWHFAPMGNLLDHASRLSARVHRLQTGKWWIWNLSFNLKLTLNLVLNALTLLAAGLLFVQGTISLGTAIGGFLMVTMVAPRFDSLYKIFNYAQASGAAYKALDQLRVKLAERPGPGPASALGMGIESIRLEVDAFRHSDERDVAISRASLDLQTGDRCLIVGASGSGKSTLVDLLLGLRISPAATLTVNGMPAADFGVDRYWSDIAYVANPDLILDDLSADQNLALYGNPDASGLGAIADRLGWETFRASIAGELSGGERQRLALLRALSRNCHMLVLDEPTSALDHANAQAVFHILAERQRSILVVISHDRQAGPLFNRRFELSDGILRECL